MENIQSILIKSQNILDYSTSYKNIYINFKFNQLIKRKKNTFMSDDARFDGILMTIIQQKGNIDGFFDTVFGFLRRSTDFFANQKKAQETIVNNCKVNFEKYTQDAKAKAQAQAKKKDQAEKKKQAKLQKQRKEKQQKEKQLKQTSKANSEPTKAQQIVTTQKTQENKEQDNTPPPKGNGGRTQKFIWTQTLQNLEMFIYLPNDTTKKQIKVEIGLKDLKVQLKGQSLVEGPWKQNINAEDSYWTIEDGQLDDYKGKYLHLTIEKWKNQMSWWSTPVKGYPEINTQKINPQPSKLSELDGQTRSTVQKMMFDMRQKQQGLPTSDELQKQQKLQEFMKAHPELDFSQCKFN